MAKVSGTRLFVKSSLVALVAVTGLAFAPAEAGRDPRVQSRLYDHLDTAERALNSGNRGEALAYAEMILLKREITVYVDDTNVPWQRKEDARRALVDAMTNWEDALERDVKFRIVSFRGADVTVQYTDGIKYEGRHAAGTVRWSRHVMDLGSGQYQYQVTANVTLRTHTPQGSMMNYAQMLHTAGHELGHIMGLEDTGRQGELMGPLRLDKPVQRATNVERQSILDVRRQADLLVERITGEQEPGPMDFRQITVLVVSESTESIAHQETATRSDDRERRPAPLRSDVRDRKAPERKKGFTVTGMAR